MKDERAKGSQRHVHRFQKATEDRQCAAGSESLKKALWSHLYETGRVKPKLKWKLKDVGDARTTGSLQRKALSYTRPVQDRD